MLEFVFKTIFSFYGIVAIGAIASLWVFIKLTGSKKTFADLIRYLYRY